MNISSLLMDLANRPLPRPIEEIYSAYMADRKWYWTKVIPHIPVEPSDHLKEPLSDCSTFDVRWSNYYANTKQLSDIDGTLVAINNHVLLRDSILVSLRKLNEVLQRAQLTVCVMSGYRSRQLQSLIIANAAREKGEAFARGQFATPEDYLPHATGAAFDIEFWDLNSNKVLRTKWPDKDDKFVIEDAHNLSAQDELVRGNRRMIHHLLTEPVVLSPGELFVAHPREYWHYGRHERLSAFFATCYGQHHRVLYDEVELDSVAEIN
jgi:D-alanyl-D-alanine dipeptidase